jgi:predicted transcriptional regulator
MPDERLPAGKPDLFVVARILEKLWTPDKEWRKTELQMAAGLNYDIYRKYLDLLEAKGLIVIEERGPRHQVVRLTAKGLDAYTTLAGWIKDVLGEV